jgi:hypothetical protein
MMEGEGDGAQRRSEELMQMNAPNFDVLSFFFNYPCPVTSITQAYQHPGMVIYGEVDGDGVLEAVVMMKVGWLDTE